MLEVACDEIGVPGFPGFHDDLIKNSVIGIGDIILNRCSVYKDTALDQSGQGYLNIVPIKPELGPVQDIVVFL